MNTIAIVSLILSPILFSSFSLDEFEFVKCSVMNLGMLLVLAILLTTTNVSRTRNWYYEVTKEWLSCGFLLLLISSVLSTILSISQRTSILGNFQSFSTLLTLLSYVVLFFTLREICKNRQNIKSLSQIGLIGGTVAAVYAVIQFAGFDPAPWQSFSTEKYLIRPFATMGHPNMLSGYLVMLLPIVLLTTRRLRYVLVPIFLFCIGVSGSRGAWLALLAGVITILYGVYKIGNRKRAWIYLGVLGCSICFGLYLLFGVIHSDTSFMHAISGRAQSMFKLDTRAYYWAAGLKTFWRYPWFGAGLDTFQITFNQLRTDAYWQVEKFGAPHKAHNELIQVAATQGLFGLLAVGLILLGGLRSYLVSWRRSTDDQRIFLLAIFSGCIAYLVQALAGFNVVATGSLFVSFLAILSGYEWIGCPDKHSYPTLEHYLNCSERQDFRPALAIGACIASVVLFLNLGFAFGTYKDNAPLAVIFTALALITLYCAWVSTGKWYIRSAVILVAITITCFRLVVMPLFASVAAKVATQTTSDKKTAVLLYQNAIRIDRSNEYYAAALGFMAEQLAVESKDPKEATEALVLALQAFEYAAKLEPLRAGNWYNQALLMAELIKRGALPQDKVKVAYPMLVRAIELEPNNPVFKSLLVNGNGAK